MIYNLKYTPLRRQQEGINQTTIWRKSIAGRGDAHGHSGAFWVCWRMGQEPGRKWEELRSEREQGVGFEGLARHEKDAEGF